MSEKSLRNCYVENATEWISLSGLCYFFSKLYNQDTLNLFSKPISNTGNVFERIVSVRWTFLEVHKV